MTLTMEIILAIALSVLIIYLKREQVKAFIKKITSYKLFPKIFWGMVLGLGVLYFEYLKSGFLGQSYLFPGINIPFQSTYIKNTSLVGALFGIFAGSTLGISSFPFSFKKLIFCIIAGLIGGLASLILFVSLIVPLRLDLLYFSVSSLTCIPISIAIGIADRSFRKAFLGVICLILSIPLYLISLIASYILAVKLADFFSPNVSRGACALVGMPNLYGWEIWPPLLAVILSGVLLILCAEVVETELGKIIKG